MTGGLGGIPATGGLSGGSGDWEAPEHCEVGLRRLGGGGGGPCTHDNLWAAVLLIQRGAHSWVSSFLGLGETGSVIGKSASLVWRIIVAYNVCVGQYGWSMVVNITAK